SEAPAGAVAMSGEEDLGTALDVDCQEKRDQTGGNQLDEYPGAVDHRHQPYAERVDDRGEEDQDRAEDHGVGREIVGATAVANHLKAAPQPWQVELQREHHGGQGDYRGGEHQPARRPTDEPAAEDLRPVVDRPRDQVFGRQLHEAERDRQLTEEHHRPRPEIGGPGGTEAEVEELKGTGEYGDITDAGREAAERPDAARERLLVAEVLHAAVGRPARLVLDHAFRSLLWGSWPGDPTRRAGSGPASKRRDR